MTTNWTRSLAEAEEATTDVPEDSVMPDETFVPGLPEECRYTADVREEGERPDLEAVRRRRMDPLADGSARSPY